jgi:hypothetical protein
MGRKPIATDVEEWEDEAAEMATLIKLQTIPGGMEHGHLAIVIPEDEYRLELEDNDYDYEEPTNPGSYPKLDRTEDDHTIKRMEAEHKEAVSDYHKYLGVTEHLRREFTTCMDPTWIEALRRPRGGYANMTIKTFFTHLRGGVARLTTKEQEDMKAKIKVVWDQTQDITTFFRRMEEELAKVERWSIKITPTEMVNHAVIQMQECGIFERKFLREWEMKPANEKEWAAMKTYFTDEFRSIQAFEPSRRTFESTKNVMEQQGHEISEFFEEFRRDAIVGNEQIQQMTQSFRGAADSMGQIMERLKASMDENKVLVDTVAKLTTSNKQLTESNKTLAEALKALGGGQAGGIQTSPATGKKYHYSNSTGEKCPICNRPHAKPFNEKCYELESNKDKRPANWKSTK